MVKHPMDLSTIRRKLGTSGKCSYHNVMDLIRDMELVLGNCLLYNSDPNHWLHKCALELRDV